MFRNIAVAYDESPEAGRALTAAIQLAAALNTSLQAITFAEELPAYTAYGVVSDPSILQTLVEDRVNFYAELQKKAQEVASAEGVQVATHLVDGDKVDAIVRCVHEYKIDLLVIGLHHRSLRVSSLWSTVYALAQAAPCNILGVH
jgi:nucleotide-binding universal stress UspA family protein